MSSRNREIFLSNLTVGRCFTIKPSTAQDDDVASKGSFRIGKTIMTPGMVWKIDENNSDEITATNVSGTQEMFNGSLIVIEVSREGFDRLKERA